MARRLLSSRARADLFGVPTDYEALVRHYLLTGNDIDLIRTRRRAENHLGLAVHISLLRYPGLGWSEDTTPPAELTAWLAEQLQISACTLDGYAARRNTRHEHHALAMRHLGLAPFGTEHVQQAENIATAAAFATDHGVKIVEALAAVLRKHRLVLPSVDTLERLAVKGRSRSRREAAAALFDAVSMEQRAQLQARLVNDPSVGQTRLTSLRGYPHSTSPASITALLDRLLHHAVVVQIEGASYRLRGHTDLVPEHLRANAPITPPPPPKRRGRPRKEKQTNL
nr:DUF4158 domain-containing protein [Thalassobacter sp. 16PALIMAR09]